MASDTVIEARSLTKKIGGRTILKSIEFDVQGGQVIGLLGKNGAGKSTLIDTLLGFALPSSGSARVFGVESGRMPAAVKARIGFVPQQDELIGLMTGTQLLALVASFHARWDRELIARLVQEWGVPMNRRIGSLSGGERQKLATLMALGHRPELLVLDEPASSLDPIARRQFMQAVVEIAGEGRTILYSSHIVADIERVASHVWIMADGDIVSRGELDALKESVVRLHLHADQALPQQLDIAGSIAMQVAGRTAVATVAGWDPAQLPALERSLGCRIEVQSLGLEEIFLAVHR
jgi:ABC-2 type transport system ATP-binding protein